MSSLSVLLVGIWSHSYHQGFLSWVECSPERSQKSQVAGLHALCHYSINTGLSSLGTGSDFTMASFLRSVPQTHSHSQLAGPSASSPLLPETFEDSEMTNTMTTAHPQPHQDVLFLNTWCRNQHYSCQAIPWPDVLHQLRNSIGGPHKASACSAPPPPTQGEIQWLILHFLYVLRLLPANRFYQLEVFSDDRLGSG